VIGPFCGANQAVRRMTTAHGGTGGFIVDVSSTASLFRSPGEYVDHAAPKGAVDTLTLGLAREVAVEDARVRPTCTRVVASQGASNDSPRLFRCSVAANRRRWLRRSPGSAQTLPPSSLVHYCT
jgi:NAD(P)-dependent dehydrogenase (short-subunit alcohol dehydrogenase family)